MLRQDHLKAAQVVVASVEDEEAANSSEKTTQIVVAGIAAGFIVLEVSLAIFLCVWCRKRRRELQEQSDNRRMLVHSPTSLAADEAHAKFIAQVCSPAGTLETPRAGTSTTRSPYISPRHDLGYADRGKSPLHSAYRASSHSPRMMPPQSPGRYLQYSSPHR